MLAPETEPLLRFLSVVLLASVPAWADLTVRYSLDLKPGEALPASVFASMKKSAGDSYAPELLFQFNGAGLAYMKYGASTALFDQQQRKLTTLVTEEKQYRVLELGEAAASPAEEDEELRQLAEATGFKLQVDTPAGTRTLNGYQVREVRLKVVGTVEGAQGDETMTCLASLWVPVEAEWKARPVLQSYRDLGGRGSPVGDPIVSLAQAFGATPQLAWYLRGLLKQQLRNQVLVQADVALLMTGMTATMAELQGKKAAAGPEKPFMGITMTLRELKEAPLPPSTYQIPQGFRPAPKEN
jgi:hypothetical protein